MSLYDYQAKRESGYIKNMNQADKIENAQTPKPSTYISYYDVSKNLSRKANNVAISVKNIFMIAPHILSLSLHTFHNR